METRILLLIHEHGSPALDAVFRLSHVLGSFPWVASVTVLATLWHAARRERMAALLWPALGLTTLGLLDALKTVVARQRPELWPRLVVETGFSFPSGHALASATFYPLLAWVVCRTAVGGGRAGLRHGLRRCAVVYRCGIALAVFVGFGRLYLGLHWPTDVLAGWVLGFAQSSLAISWLRRQRPEEPMASVDGP